MASSTEFVTEAELRGGSRPAPGRHGAGATTARKVSARRDSDRLGHGLASAAAAFLLAIALLPSCSGGGNEQEAAGSVELRWSNPLTWATGVVPAANDNVSIALGQTIILDVQTPALDTLRIEGTLVADPLLDVAITANCIEVMTGGTLQIGEETRPFVNSAVLTLTGPRGTHTTRTEDNALDNDGVQRAIRVMDGGTIRLFGATPSLLSTKLNTHAAAATSTFTVADSVNWRAGDQIAISTTDFYGVGETEVLTLASDTNGTTLHTTTGLGTFRWGRLQYPIDTPVNGTAMSLTQGPFTPADATTPLFLDERAEVANLSRKIVIQGADDSDWNSNGFGVHVMVMGLASTAQVQGCEFRRCGQRRAMGRYPFHWHMMSYSPASASGQGGGQHLGDVIEGDHYLKDCAVWDSQNRAVTIHGTCGVTVDNVYAVDIKGHAFFMEDGSERRNTITNCLAMKVRDPGATNRLKLHDDEASGFWLTNPDNVVTNNSGSDCVGRGLWNSFAATCFGLSRNCAISPQNIEIGLYEDNTGHSNRLQGIITNFVVNDEAGMTVELKYLPDLAHTFTLARNIVWKNNDGGYKNRVGAARYQAWTAADNNTRDFAGQTNRASMTGTLLIGQSLNNATPFADPRRIGLSSYHYEIDFINITFVNYPFAEPILDGSVVYGAGAFDSSDIYAYSIGVAGARNTGWRLINSNAGYITPAPYFDTFPLALTYIPGRFRYWSIPAIWDPHGYWGPAGNYLITDRPFYTYGLSQSVNVSPVTRNGLSTPDLFYGLGSILLDNDDGEGGTSLIALRCGRLNTSNVEIDEHTIGDPALSAFLPNMRHFSLAKGGRYKVTFPSGRLPTTKLVMVLNNAYRPSDSVLIGVPWPGSVPVAGRLDSGWGGGTESQRVASGTTRLFSATGTSIATVLGDATGATIWQDSPNNTVWINPRGGLTMNVAGGFDGRSDASLERPVVIRLRVGP